MKICHFNDDRLFMSLEVYSFLKILFVQGWFQENKFTIITLKTKYGALSLLTHGEE